MKRKEEREKREKKRRKRKERKKEKKRRKREKERAAESERGGRAEREGGDRSAAIMSCCRRRLCRRRSPLSPGEHFQRCFF